MKDIFYCLVQVDCLDLATSYSIRASLRQPPRGPSPASSTSVWSPLAPSLVLSVFRCSRLVFIACLPSRHPSLQRTDKVRNLCCSCAHFLQLLDTSRFGQEDELKFFRINDEVMGGRSISSMDYSPADGLLFSGEINTNGGGFASCRTLGDDVPLGLSNGTQSALIVDATGDGQLHKVMLYTADSWQMSTPSWAHDFLAAKKRSTYRLPLSAFVPSKQGRVARGVQLNGAEITGIGFSLSLYSADGKPNPSFGAGPFRPHVHGVREVRDGIESRVS